MRRVEIIRLVQHPRYKKYVKHRTICYVHDENDESRVGDQVEIMESRPLSRLKRWRLVRVVARGRAELIEKRREAEVELQAVSKGETEASGTEAGPASQSGNA
jgi:small subunit ribosomal protein S17